LLEEQVQQRRELGPAFLGVHDVASQAREYSISILGPASPSLISHNDFAVRADRRQEPSGLGVFIADTYVLTHSAALDGRSSLELTVGAGAANVAANVVAYEPATGLVLLQTEPSGRAAATLATQAPAAGALAVGVGRSSQDDIAIPVFVTRAGDSRYTIGADDAILPGMPIFTLAGELFAVAAPAGREIRAVPVREAAERLIARASTGERLSSVGIGFQAPAGLLTRAFGEEGVIVTEVLEGGPADLGGIQVGDVILRIGDVPIDSNDTATRQLSSATIDTPTRFEVRRSGRIREVEVTPALAYEVASLARTRAETPVGPEARVVFSADLLEAYAIPRSARVLSVNGRALSSRAQVQRELRLARGPVPVLVADGDHRFFAAIEPSR
jgi:S1-C subfamily serine protease